MAWARRLTIPFALVAAFAGAGAQAGEAPKRNVLIFVADGLRSGMVTPQNAPTMAALRAKGVDLTNSHSLYPTVTTPNASAIATGHRLGDTGDFGNVLYVGAPTNKASSSPFASVEDDNTLGGLNDMFGGDFLGETSLMAVARQAGYATVAIGKMGPTAIQDVTQRDGKGALVIDDHTGQPGGFPLPADVTAAIVAAGLPAAAASRGPNGSSGAYNQPGTTVANVQQQDWFTHVATKVLLPRLKAGSAPFVMLFWSRDPDGTQHFQGDSLNSLNPGINGPTSLAAIRNADDDLARLLQALRDQGLADNTDIFVIADHGFSTVAKQGSASYAAQLPYPDVPKGYLPRGFLAIDLAAWLKTPLFDGAGQPVDYTTGDHPKSDAALVGPAKAPLIAVAENGGTDLLYLPGPDASKLAAKTVAWLTRQDYTGAIFVNDALGPVPGALPMSKVGLMGSALTPAPSIIVSFRSVSTGCADPELCAAEVADTAYQQGQGIHGAFSRADTHNFMTAAGPDFREGFRDPAPVSNADVAPTLAAVLGLSKPDHGTLKGRVLTEILKDGAPVDSTSDVVRSTRAANGFRTVLDEQSAGGEAYFDAAGAPGRVVGLHP